MNKQYICSEIVQCIGKAWTNELFYDVDVEIDGKSIKCHRFILAACSKFFKRMFKSKNKTNLLIVSLKNISFDVFQLILHCLYTGEFTLTTENYFEVWRAVSIFKIQFLLTLCETFAIEAINIDTWENIYKIAEIVKSKKVRHQINLFMLKNFEQISLSETFLEQLCYLQVRGLIKSQDLNVKNEDIVLEAVLRWVNHVPTVSRELVETNGDVVNNDKGTNTRGQLASVNIPTPGCKDVSRKEKLPFLLSCVRTCFVSHSLLTRVYKMEMVSTNKDSREIIVKAILYHVKNFRQSHWPSAALHRSCSGYTHGGVFAVDGGNFKFISAYDEKMYTITKSDLLQDSVQFTTVQGELFAIGKQLSSRSGEFNIAVFRENKWNFVMKIKDCNLFFSQRDLIHSYNQEDHVLKSINSQSIEIVTKDIMLKNHPYVVHAMSLENYILFFYSELFHGMDTTSVIKFDLCSKSAKKIAMLQGSAEYMTSFRNDIYYYILMKDGCVWQVEYFPHSVNFEFHCLIKLWEFDREVYGAFAYDEKLIIFGKVPNSSGRQNHQIANHFSLVKYWGMDAKCSNIAPVILPTAILNEVDCDL